MNGYISFFSLFKIDFIFYNYATLNLLSNSVNINKDVFLVGISIFFIAILIYRKIFILILRKHT